MNVGLGFAQTRWCDDYWSMYCERRFACALRPLPKVDILVKQVIRLPERHSWMF